MIKKTRQSIGYSGKSLLTTSHTTRLMKPEAYSDKGMEQIVMENLRDFRTLVKFNGTNGLFLYKMNGDLIPMGTHPVNTFDWQKTYQHIFESIGKWMENERFRLLIEPVECIRLGQEQERNVLKDVSVLRYYVKLMDTMKLSQYNKVLLRIGQYENQKNGEALFIKNYFRLPQYIKNRIVLCNDIDGHSIEDTIRIANEIQVPVVLNYYKENNLNDFVDIMRKYIRDIQMSWKPNDGSPIVQIFETKEKADTKFLKVLPYIEIKKISDFVTKENISIIYESVFKDISAIKMSNTIVESKGVFSKNACVEEWQRYRHVIMAHDPDGFVEMQTYMENPKSFDVFYEKIEKIMSRFKLIPNDIFAAEELLLDFKEVIKSKERTQAMTLLKERKMAEYKDYCHHLAEKYDVDYLMSSYYFHLE